MIEAIAVTLQDEIAAHSFDELTGERHWPARRCSIGRSRAGRPTTPSARPALWQPVPRRASDLVLCANGWSDVECDPEVLFMLSHLAPACAIKPCFVAHRW